MADSSEPYTGPIVTRAEAKAAGLHRFFTGKPCKHGHLAQRLVGHAGCIVCSKARAAVWWAQNPEKAAARRQKYRAENREQIASQRQEYRRTHREQLNEDARRRRAADPSKAAAYAASWRAANRAKVREYEQKSRIKRQAKRREEWVRWAQRSKERLKDYQQANKVRAKIRSQRWRHENRDAVNAITHRRRARLRGAVGSYTPDDVRNLFDLQKGKCAHSWCRSSLAKGYHIDHVIPLARGGANDRRNIQLLCAPCNHRKNAKHPVDFAQENGLLL